MLLLLYIQNFLHVDVTDDFELYTQFSVILLFFAVNIVFLKIDKKKLKKIKKKRKKERKKKKLIKMSKIVGHLFCPNLTWYPKFFRNFAIFYTLESWIIGGVGIIEGVGHCNNY